jgi:hypothetical protein
LPEKKMFSTEVGEVDMLAAIQQGQAGQAGGGGSRDSLNKSFG